MSKLRELKIEDAEKMHECITDSEVSGLLSLGRYPKSIECIYEFISKSRKDEKNIHFTIADANDKYLGTISLKNICYIDRNAEYAIIIHKDYWNRGFASVATDQILEYAFKRLNLNKVYLNVPSINLRANKFYEKYGFEKEGVFKKHFFINGEFVDLYWYCKFNSASVGGAGR